MKRVLLSVSDKTGIEGFARELVHMGWEIISSGGTAGFLREKGLEVMEISQVTGFEEILDGRVKTLHPKIHGGILAVRDKEKHMEELAAHGVTPVDMVVCNLYPFVEAIKKPGVTIEEAVEQIDIGGPTLIRAAAKNYPWVTVVCSPERYHDVVTQLKTQGEVGEDLRRTLALEAFSHTASYDAAIASYFQSLWGSGPWKPAENLVLSYGKAFDLRYGENPHQQAAYYEPFAKRDALSLRRAQIQGKALSYNNINDLDNAFHTAWDLSSEGCVIVKHAAPCGVALGATPREAFDEAFRGDPLSAFGGIVCFNCDVDEECAARMKDIFLEVVAAPAFTTGALKILGSKKNLRLLALKPQGDACTDRLTLKSALGGMLVQEQDFAGADCCSWKVVSKRQPTREELQSLEFAMTVCKHVKSNSIVLAQGKSTVGIGGGQPNRVDAVKIAVTRAGERAKGSCLASDAFFPFPDSVHEAAKAGVAAIMHPGGSIKDEESIDAADAHGISMVITGRRHFLH